MTTWSAARGPGLRGAGLAAREWSRIRLSCVAVSVAMFALAVVVLGALTPGYNPWSDTVSRLGSPGERWALATRVVFMVYGLLVITGAGTLRPSVRRHGRTLALLLSLYGVTCIVAGLAPKDQPGVHTIASQVHVASTVVGGTLAIGAMLLVARYGRIPRARRAAAVLALLTTAAAVVLRCTWGTPVYGLSERVVLGLGMGWISALAGSALYQERSRAR
jgi:hypothetical membrane protein